MPIFVDSLVCLSVYPLAYSIKFFVSPSLHLLPHLLLMIAILATTRMMMNITFLMVVKLFVCLLVWLLAHPFSFLILTCVIRHVCQPLRPLVNSYVSISLPYPYASLLLSMLVWLCPYLCLLAWLSVLLVWLSASVCSSVFLHVGMRAYSPVCLLVWLLDRLPSTLFTSPSQMRSLFGWLSFAIVGMRVVGLPMPMILSVWPSTLLLIYVQV